MKEALSLQDWCCIIASGYPFGCISEYTLETMIGTIVNATTIIVGGIIGSLLHRGVKEKYKEVLYTGLGLASLAIGLNATISHFSQSQYPVLFIISLAIGGVIGTALDIDGRFKRLVDKLQREKKKDGNRLAEGLSTAILLYCIGPLSMLGPVISALKGDHTFLFTNALVAHISSTAVSDALMAELLIVGGLLITGSGLSLLNLKDCKTLNLLPALLVPVVWFLICSIISV